MKAKKTGWLTEKLKDPEYRRLFARECFTEDFLNKADEVMQKDKISKSELAKRLKCSGAYVTLLFQSRRRLSANMIVDIAFHLGLKLKLNIEGDKYEPQKNMV